MIIQPTDEMVLYCRTALDSKQQEFWLSNFEGWVPVVSDEPSLLKDCLCYEGTYYLAAHFFDAIPEDELVISNSAIDFILKFHDVFETPNPLRMFNRGDSIRITFQ